MNRSIYPVQCAKYLIIKWQMNLQKLFVLTVACDNDDLIKISCGMNIVTMKLY